ncbi:hypothetical protein H4R34_001573 [Dimargaris verticillata]|uniref:Uncharacterized protein n=1 Tax=Dimargaris verticillata TaxID=2761393 RepID=A0A9W8BB48_9FUNG|nr:hypothetical protein H4R34_001573 [Dimargaris verticillata]
MSDQTTLHSLADAANLVRDQTTTTAPTSSAAMLAPLTVGSEPNQRGIALPPISNLTLVSPAPSASGLPTDPAITHTTSGEGSLGNCLAHPPLPARAVARTVGHRKTHSMSILSIIENQQQQQVPSGGGAPRPPLTPTMDASPNPLVTSPRRHYRKHPSYADLRDHSRTTRPNLDAPASRMRQAHEPHHGSGPPPPLPSESGHPSNGVAGSMGSHRRHQSWSVGQNGCDQPWNRPDAQPGLPELPTGRYATAHHPYARMRYPPSRRDDGGYLPYPLPPGSHRPPEPPKLKHNATHAFIAYMIYLDQLRTGAVKSKRLPHHAHSQSDAGLPPPRGFAVRESSPGASAFREVGSFAHGGGHGRSKTISAFRSPGLAPLDPPPLPSHEQPLLPQHQHQPHQHPRAHVAAPPSRLGLGNHSLTSHHTRSVSHSGIGGGMYRGNGGGGLASRHSPTRTAGSARLPPIDDGGAPLSSEYSMASGYAPPTSSAYRSYESPLGHSRPPRP